MKRRRKIADSIRMGITYAASLFSVLVLGAILIYVFTNGIGLISLDFILGDGTNTTQTLQVDPQAQIDYDIPEDDEVEGTYGSKRYGVVFQEKTNYEGYPIIVIVYLNPNSPLKSAYIIATDQVKPLSVGDSFYGAGLLLWGDDGKQVKVKISEGAKKFAQAFDQTEEIASIPVTILGKGIRGSIVTTLYLIVLTLLIALPIGVGSALYLHEIAPQNKVTSIMRTFVDMLTGIPSIIYGLMGAAVFIPLTRKLFGYDVITGGSILSGALTLAVIVLPVIIKSTESALDVVPKEYKSASLALGATKIQTTFKVMLPNAIPGILSAVLLSIGRVMGESAALIYALGTVFQDSIKVTGNGTSLAVHIWSAMGGDSPNFALASAISLIILVVVLSLNLIIKFITNRFIKRFG